jgi:CRP-like cAMP-binding protein
VRKKRNTCWHSNQFAILLHAMPDTPERFYNLLLAALSEEDLGALGEMESVELKVRQVLEKAGEPIPAIYFPQNGLVSVVAQTKTQQSIEVGMIGYEGMTGISVMMGIDRAANQVIVQARGEALRVPVCTLESAMQSRPGIASIFRRYVQVFIAQASQTALANGRGLLAQRLARWLLMGHDRTRRKDLSVTHGSLGVLLGTRRASVALALHALEERGLVRTKRHVIEVLDRAGLEAAANGYYGIPEAEYARLLAPLIKRGGGSRDVRH